MFSNKFLRSAIRLLGQCRTNAVETLCVVQRTRTTEPVKRISVGSTTLPWRCYSVDSNHEDDRTGKKDSSNNDSTHKTEDEIRKEILENALSYVQTHGWSRDALAASAEDLGYPSVAEGIFSCGETELVLYFIRSSNESLRSYMEDKCSDDKENTKTSHFIRHAIEHRLRMIIPYVETWPEAMAVLVQPSVIMYSVQELGEMVDDIWFYAGDKSTDFNWYTKRGILAKLYLSTQTVMVNDQSPDFNDTWEFLDRRMKDVATFGKVTAAIQRQGRIVADVGYAGFTVLRNIAGLGEQRR